MFESGDGFDTPVTRQKVGTPLNEAVSGAGQPGGIESTGSYRLGGCDPGIFQCQLDRLSQFTGFPCAAPVKIATNKGAKIKYAFWFMSSRPPNHRAFARSEKDISRIGATGPWD